MSKAIEIVGVSKEFRIPNERFASLKERVLHRGKVGHEVFHALEDINIAIDEGETFALLGHNGSGKSTLLKCVAGILRPTTGEVRVRGRMAALLELGAGFHPDLTGRENVFMNATLLGISEKEIASKFDEIVAFAELEQFIDTQVKHYSSGMYVRLGFAVAVNTDPDILLVDEVLAVGDEAFQRKCLERIRQFQREGRTIVVVTHSADMVRQVCDRAAVLDHGLKVAEGPTVEAIRTYREYLQKRGVPVESVDSEALAEGDVAGAIIRSGAKATSADTPKVQILGVALDHDHGKQRAYLLPNEELRINVAYRINEVLDDDVVFGVTVYDVEGRVVSGFNTDILHVDTADIYREGTVSFVLQQVPLLDGDYSVSVGAHNRDGGTMYDFTEQAHHFEVMNPERTVGQVYLPVDVTFHPAD